MKRIFPALFVCALMVLSQTHFPIAQNQDGGYDGEGTDTNLPGTSIKYKGMIAADVDNDGVEELVCDFSSDGIWLFDWNHTPRWVRIKTDDPDAMIAFDHDGNGEVEILAAYEAGEGKVEHWTWQSGNQKGSWIQFSGSWHVDWMLAADVDGDGSDEAVLQLTHSSLPREELWIRNSFWNWQLIYDGDTDFGWAAALGTADEEIIVQKSGGNLEYWDFTSWADGDFTDQWTVMTPTDADMVDSRVGNVDGDAEEEFIADLFSDGVWIYNHSSTPKWSKLHFTLISDLHLENILNDGRQEIFPGFVGSTWYYEMGVGWKKISSLNPALDAGWIESTDNGTADGDGTKEIACDFATSGLWLYDGSASPKWQRITPINPESMVELDYNGGGATELVCDFGGAGIWIYDPGHSPRWIQLSSSNPENK